MEHLDFDVVIIGTGLGAATIAQRLAGAGARVAMTPGVGCARFKHLDGGLVALETLESAFGTSAGAPLHAVGERSSFRRDQLEQWAIGHIRDRVTLIDGFNDLRIQPHPGDGHAVHEESGTRQLVARQIILAEGASPKIGIAARIRPDFEPEDLLHFGRAILRGAAIDEPVSGTWRTSWNMPAWYTVVPHPYGAIVGASARIENIMRVGRDGREVVRDFLTSSVAQQLGLASDAGEIGMELVPLRRDGHISVVTAGDILITPDANGAIDPRSLQRFESVLTAGTVIGQSVARVWPNTLDPETHGDDFHDVFQGSETPYHDCSETGFIEEGPGKPQGLLRRLLKR